jgi:threonine dehydrogenase-like Zn-dependent dehydrogenase
MAVLQQSERIFMKALVYTGLNEVTYREELTPEPQVGEAKIRIEAVGICGSDMHAYHGEDARPRSRRNCCFRK